MKFVGAAHDAMSRGASRRSAMLRSWSRELSDAAIF
jgi:hypothetical protein